MLEFLSKLIGNAAGAKVRPTVHDAPPLQEHSPLAAFYERAPLGMALLDREQRLLEINPWLARILGAEEQSLLGKTLAEILPQLAPQLAAPLEQVFVSGRSVADVDINALQLADGATHSWSLRFDPLANTAGDVRATCMFVQDVTEHRQTHQALTAANDRIGDILESIPGGFVAFDRRWRYRYVNRTAAGMLRSQVEEMLGKTALAAFPAARGTVFEAKLREARETGLPLKFEAYFEGFGAWFECHCYPADDGLSVFFVDTTQTRSTQQRLRKSETESRRLAAVVENCNDFVGICTRHGEPIYLNKAGRAMVGLDPDEEIAGTHFLSFFAPEDHVLMTSVGIPALKKQGRWKGEVHFKNQRTGERIPSLWNVFVIKDPDGELPEVWATVSPDLSEQKRMELQLRASEQRALQANVAKSEFLANMSHEIRTPMAAILGYADVMLGRLADADDRGNVMIIKNNGEHLLELINDILDLSRIEAGKLEVDRQTVDLPRLIADVLTLMHIRADEKGLELAHRCDAPIPQSVRTDPTRVRQVLINLIGNAIKFTEQGRVELAIRYAAAAPQPVIEFEVNDTGIGMTDEQQSRLFQPFSQGDSSVTRAFGGSGLGLAISKRLIEMLDGELHFESTAGIGTRFRVRIPIETLPDGRLVAPDLEDVSRTAPAVAARRHLSCRVLVVDDRRDVRFISQYFLETAGATVATAEDGQLAIEAVQRAIDDGQPFDVIVMDMQMPNVDGYQAAAALRAAGVEQPIIALTADAMKGDRERCLQAGCDDYVSKPIQQAQFIEMVARYTLDFSFEELRQRRRETRE